MNVKDVKSLLLEIKNEQQESYADLLNKIEDFEIPE